MLWVATSTASPLCYQLEKQPFQNYNIEELTSASDFALLSTRLELFQLVFPLLETDVTEYRLLVDTDTIIHWMWFLPGYWWQQNLSLDWPLCQSPAKMFIDNKLVCYFGRRNLCTLAILMRLVVFRTTYIFWITWAQVHVTDRLESFLDPVCTMSALKAQTVSPVYTMSTLKAQTRLLSTRCLQHVADYKKVQIHPPSTPPQWYRPLKYFEDPFTSQTTNWVFAGVVHQGRKK